MEKGTEWWVPGLLEVNWPKYNWERKEGAGGFLGRLVIVKL